MDRMLHWIHMILHKGVVKCALCKIYFNIFLSSSFVSLNKSILKQASWEGFGLNFFRLT